MNKKFVYEFKDECKYFFAGKEAVAETLTVYAPNNKVLNEVSILEMEYRKAEMTQQKKAMAITSTFDSASIEKMIAERREELAVKKTNEEMKKEEEKKEETTKHLTADDILNVLFYGEANIMECFKALNKILTINLSGIAFAYLDESDGKGERLTSNYFDAMTPQDTKQILGEYISTFIIASQNG